MITTIILIVLVLGFGVACYLRAVVLAHIWFGSVLVATAYATSGANLTLVGDLAWLYGIGLSIVLGSLIGGTLKEALKLSSQKKASDAKP